MLIWIVTKKFTAGIEANETGKIINAPPICIWTMNMTAKYLKEYLIEEGELIDWIEVETCEKQKQNQN